MGKVRCPACYGANRVIDVRINFSAIVRRRKCEACGCRWTTEERTRPGSITKPRQQRPGSRQLLLAGF